MQQLFVTQPLLRYRGLSQVFSRPRLAAFSAQEMPSEELEYANIAQKPRPQRSLPAAKANDILS